MEDSLALLIYEERIDIAPLMARQQVLDLLQSGVHRGHSDQLLVHFAHGRHRVRDGQAQAAAVDVGRRPQAVLLRVRARRKKLVVVVHLRDEILAVSKLPERAVVLAGQEARQLLTIVDRQVAEDTCLWYQIAVLGIHKIPDLSQNTLTISCFLNPIII